VQATRNLHDEIIKVSGGIAKDIVHNAAPFDPSNDMFNKDPNTGNDLVLGFVFSTEFLIPWFFLRLIGTDMVWFKALEARIFKEDTARRKRIAFLIANTFVVDAASKRPTEIAYQTLFRSRFKILAEITPMS
jgi:hypothetical protein